MLKSYQHPINIILNFKNNCAQLRTYAVLNLYCYYYELFICILLELAPAKLIPVTFSCIIFGTVDFYFDTVIFALVTFVLFVPSRELKLINLKEI